MNQLNRRQVLKLLAGASAAVTVSTALSGCASAVEAEKLTPVTFTHGVASGDPTTSALILWTRALPQDSQKSFATIGWDVARDPEFNDIIRSGTTTTQASRDFTAKVDVQQLPAGIQLFYRFRGADTTSTVGRGKTIPNGNIDNLNFAVFSCSNYPAGFFHPYHHASQDDSIDAVLHLGDYIYEYGGDGYATEDAERMGRTFPANNNGEIVELVDYRRRYATYRSDEGLQALHAHAPFIVVWDDHEVANDTWKGGAENHQPKTEGDFLKRRAAAVQAYFEWLPIRPPQGDSSLQIYRTFSFGELADLIMLDTRVIGRDKQLSYDNYMNKETGEFDQEGFTKAMQSDRSILGKPQLQWFMQQLQQSDARWQIIGQQLLMARMNFPAAIFSQGDRSKIAPLLIQAAELKKRQQQGGSLTAQQKQLIETVMPYNLDAWDGYPVEREMVMQAAQKMGKPLVVLAGDTHNAWHSELTTMQGQVVGVEYGVSSVSSPGMETYLSMNSDTAEKVAKALPVLVNDLQFSNMHQRGYMMLNVNKDQITNEWRFVNTVKEKDYRLASTHKAVFTG